MYYEGGTGVIIIYFLNEDMFSTPLMYTLQKQKKYSFNNHRVEGVGIR